MRKGDRTTSATVSFDAQRQQAPYTGPHETNHTGIGDKAQAPKRRNFGVVPNLVLDSRELRSCSLLAQLLYERAWIYANRHRTDGNITRDDLGTLAGSMGNRVGLDDVLTAAGELVSVGLWLDGYQIANYLLTAKSKTEITAAASASYVRLKEWRQRKDALAASPGFPPDPPSSEGVKESQKKSNTNSVGNAVSNGVSDKRRVAEEVVRLLTAGLVSPSDRQAAILTAISKLPASYDALAKSWQDIAELVAWPAPVAS